MPLPAGTLPTLPVRGGRCTGGITLRRIEQAHAGAVGQLQHALGHDLIAFGDVAA